MIEFTGERVVPGQVDADLWNEHVARYAFAARLATGKRVLDAGCGSGYGSSELARTARRVFSLDVANDAVRYARESYGAPNTAFLQASAAAIPLASASVDLVVSFEVIEHIPEWSEFLSEARRLLAPGGRLVVSTPNKDYYSGTRGESGPNPYHVHEFTYDEFHSALDRMFPSVHMYVENHVAGLSFYPLEKTDRVPELCASDGTADPATAHFFVAVCSLEPQAPPPAFLYVPTAANVLYERELHIAKLEANVEHLRREKEQLVEIFRAQTAELEKSNQWAKGLDGEIAVARERIADLQRENERKTEWALSLQARLDHIRNMRTVKLVKRLGIRFPVDQ